MSCTGETSTSVTRSAPCFGFTVPIIVVYFNTQYRVYHIVLNTVPGNYRSILKLGSHNPGCFHYYNIFRLKNLHYIELQHVSGAEAPHGAT